MYEQNPATTKQKKLKQKKKEIGSKLQTKL